MEISIERTLARIDTAPSRKLLFLERMLGHRFSVWLNRLREPQAALWMSLPPLAL